MEKKTKSLRSIKIIITAIRKLLVDLSHNINFRQKILKPDIVSIDGYYLPIISYHHHYFRAAEKTSEDKSDASNRLHVKFYNIDLHVHGVNC